MSILRRLEATSLATIALLALGISILDLSGALDGLDWLKARIPVLTLLASAAIISHLAIRGWTSANDIEKAMISVVRSLDGTQVQEFGSRATFWQYFAERIRGARVSVDDLTWGREGASSMSKEDLDAYAEYRDAIKAASTGRGAHRMTIYRELMSFPTGRRIGKAKPLMDERFPNYHLKYYEFDHRGTPQMLQFTVVDNEVVLMGVTSDTLSGRDHWFVAFSNQRLATIFAHFFEIAWRGGISLKSLEGLDLATFSALESRFARGDVGDVGDVGDIGVRG